MPSTRRHVLTLGLGLLAPLTGCSAFDKPTTVAELEIDLVNQTSDSHVFIVAVETTDGLGEWDSREVAPGTRESVVREGSEDYDPIAIHGVVDDQQVSGDLLSRKNEPAGLCLRVMFEYGLGDEPTLLESSDIRC
ncbi:hypothetical protein [Haloarchaeobius sp. HRN-SO-5]|uniref:hypothetical protein n=1 Tax=Haloarchaeobius sp. HRN-SO-5 TaxID=3446118 RepID=UPI003EBD6B35